MKIKRYYDTGLVIAVAVTKVAYSSYSNYVFLSFLLIIISVAVINTAM